MTNVSANFTKHYFCSIYTKEVECKTVHLTLHTHHIIPKLPLRCDQLKYRYTNIDIAYKQMFLVSVTTTKTFPIENI